MAISSSPTVLWGARNKNNSDFARETFCSIECDPNFALFFVSPADDGLINAGWACLKVTTVGEVRERVR